MIEINVQPDHVHLVVQTNADDSPSEIMKLIKGDTSKKLRELVPNLIETVWSKSF